MNVKNYFMLLTLLLFSTASVLAQEKTISGTISDQSGMPLPGVNIIVKGTTNGTQSDFDGNYTINTTAGAVLTFTYVGLKTVERTVGTTNTINVTMEEDAAALDEVVVTAFGIKKEKKALGYAVSTISAEEISGKAEKDIARALVGKAPGVDITQTSGLAGSGTNIIIRGYSSITGDNQPLFVVDGVPFNTDTNNDRGFTGGSTTASSRFLDLDPANVASISILKGLSATVLYGERGRNGVILVTTKSGASGSLTKKFEVSLSQSVYFSEINLPDYQNSYGNGFYQSYSQAFSNWGPAFTDAGTNGIDADGTVPHPYDRAALADAFPEFQGARYDYKAYDNVKEFFDTGVAVTTSLGISGRKEDVSYNFNYGHTEDKGFTPGNKYLRDAFSLGGQTQLANGLKLVSTFNFTKTTKDSPPTAAGFGSNPSGGTASLFSNILYTPRSVDLNGLPWENPIDHSSVYYRGGNDIQNPYWTLNNIKDHEVVDRFFTSTNLVYDINDWLSVSYQLGLDTYTQKQVYTANKGGTQIPDGVMITSVRLNNIWDHTISVNFNKELSDKLAISGILGANSKSETREYSVLASTQQFIYGLLTHGNFTNHDAGSFNSKENNLGVYTSITLEYDNSIYLNVQGRNDWTSTLERDNRSIFYPSASVSFIPTSFFEGLKSESGSGLNYLKLRFGYGTSAGFPDPYQTRIGLGTSTNSFINPINGNVMNLMTVSNQLGNLNLKPETHKEYEAGIEAKLYRNRINLDLSVYDKQSSDLIIARSLDPSSGFTNTTVNTAKISNRGIELGLNLVPVRTDDFTWNLNGIFSLNENIVESLDEGVLQLPIAGFTNLGNFAIPGKSYGIMQGSKMVRDDNGVPVVGSNGRYISTTDIGIIGDPNPDYKLTGITSFSYKGFELAAQMEYVHGGDIYSTTAAALISRGLSKDTDFDRSKTVILPGVKQDGSTNDIQIAATDAGFYSSGFFIDERAVYDGTTIRLRELSLSYTVPKKLLEKTPFGSVSFSVVGQNLWFKAVNFPEHINFDTEVMSLGVGNGRGFDYLTGPTSKKYGFSLKLTF